MAIPVAQVLSHWTHMFPNLSLSANDFYSKVETALKERKMPDTRVERVNHKEGGMFSSSREYLRAQHRDLVFDICAAPFGTDFFISWWLYETQGMMQTLLKHTKVGDILIERAAKRTFFEADKELMFRTAVHNVVLEVVRKTSEEKGIRMLSESEMAVTEGGI